MRGIWMLVSGQIIMFGGPFGGALGVINKRRALCS
jgi:hypothetical protein